MANYKFKSTVEIVTHMLGKHGEKQTLLDQMNEI